MSTRRSSWLPVLSLLMLLTAACGGGGGSDNAAGDDPLAPVGGIEAPAGERAVQFEGAGKVKLFGTFTMPATHVGANVPGVLRIPTSGAGGLLQSGVNDPLGKDLAETFAGAGVASYRYDQRGTGGGGGGGEGGGGFVEHLAPTPKRTSPPSP
ncbi:MAG: hypothetical protein ACR2HM_02890, partial [Acidimicrobiales bacterium]